VLRRKEPDQLDVMDVWRQSCRPSKTRAPELLSSRRFATRELFVQLIRIDRLGHVSIKTRCQRMPLIVFVSPTCQSHEPQTVTPLRGAAFARHLVAIELRHSHIEDCDVRSYRSAMSRDRALHDRLPGWHRRRIGRLLDTIEAWPANAQHPLYKATYRAALILLYTTGMRRGELARLTLADVDLRNRTLHIRESKFHKTRIVPISSSATRELRRYLRFRLAPPWDISVEAPLLGDQHGSAHFRAYAPGALGQGLRKLFRDANVRDPHGRYPRVHDIRHSFAIQALLRWYHAGADVQAKLPQLSMYLGHVSIVSTAYYLYFIPEIAAAAHRRFARHFGHVAQGGVR
jgi:integrase